MADGGWRLGLAGGVRRIADGVWCMGGEVRRAVGGGWWMAGDMRRLADGRRRER